MIEHGPLRGFQGSSGQNRPYRRWNPSNDRKLQYRAEETLEAAAAREEAPTWQQANARARWNVGGRERLIHRSAGGYAVSHRQAPDEATWIPSEWAESA